MKLRKKPATLQYMQAAAYAHGPAGVLLRNNRTHTSRYSGGGVKQMTALKCMSASAAAQRARLISAHWRVIIRRECGYTGDDAECISKPAAAEAEASLNSTQHSHVRNSSAPSVCIQTPHVWLDVASRQRDMLSLNARPDRTNSIHVLS